MWNQFYKLSTNHPNHLQLFTEQVRDQKEKKKKTQSPVK